MLRVHLAGTTAAALVASGFAVPAQAQQPAPPPFATTKVTDNVYIFRYGGHQSMFIVTPAGVIATDPISERRPAKPYIDAIQAVTKTPIKYVVYSHSHFDHIAGGDANTDRCRSCQECPSVHGFSSRLVARSVATSDRGKRSRRNGRLI